MQYPYPDLYLTHLKVINGINFTRREVDVMAYTLSGRAAGEIARFLGLTSKGVEAHMYNIRRKLEVSSKNGIIDFIENSGKLPLIRSHYKNLQVLNVFIASLNKILPLIKDISPIHCAIHWNLSKKNTQFVNALEHYLKSAKIQIQETSANLPSSNTDKPTLLVLDNLNDLKNEKLKLYIHKPNILFVILGEKTVTNEIPPLRYISCKNGNFFYHTIFQILEKLLPHHAIEINKAFSQFEKDFQRIEDLDNTLNIPDQQNPPWEKKTVAKNFQSYFKNKKLFQPIKVISSLSILLLLSFIIKENFKTSSAKFDAQAQTVHSDLIIPTKSALLVRPNLIKEIGTKLNQPEDISIVAIIGMGGVGKTTLSRSFGRLQKDSIVWELNAETKESLISSFRDLAYALANTKEDKEELEFIKVIQNLEEREKQLLMFVKRHLKAHPNWLLIYDNIEAFPDIKNYIPQDANVWGNGKVIITTRDRNILNSCYINPKSFIEIEELSQNEALTLFTKILYNCELEKLSLAQKEETAQFLKQIPAFPLDVSVAAYYLKDTHITYEQYLKRINQYGKDFETIQTNFLKESTNYEKNRYGIISLSFKKIIETNPEFMDLLFFICLLDSQNIPIKLLEQYKSSAIVEEFMHALRKYSLITSETSISNKGLVHTFNLHRSTQYLGKKYLLNILGQYNKTKLLNESFFALKSFFNRYSKNYDRAILLVVHIEVFLKNLTLINFLKSAKLSYLSALSFILGHIYDELGNRELAKYYLTQFIQNEDKFISIGDLALGFMSLADVCAALNEIDKALYYSKKSLDICRKIEDAEILITKNLEIIGRIYYQKGNFLNAEKYFKQSLSAAFTIKDPFIKQDFIGTCYARLGVIYSESFLSKKSYLALENIQNALKTLNAFQSIYDSKQKFSLAVARTKARLGEIYCRIGKYKDAEIKGFKEAQFLLDSKLIVSLHHKNGVELPIILGMAEISLRKANLNDAEIKLTKYIKEAKVLVGNSFIFKAKVYRAEALIRLKKFEQAYEDCLSVFQQKNRRLDRYSSLMYLTSFYHGAFIKYKQNDFKKSIEHFNGFLKFMQEFCKGFLDEKEYKVLDTKGAFTVSPYNTHYAKEDIQKYLKNSVYIFTVIYGKDHPFIKDYIVPNYEESIKLWWKFW